MAIVMKWSGIEGESQIAGFEKMIPLLSFSWGATRNMVRNRTAVQDRSAPTVQEIQVTKSLDKASTGLQLDALLGKFDATVSIHFLRTGTAGLIPFFVVNLEGAGLAGYQVSAGPEETPIEQLSISFTKIELTVLSAVDDLTSVQDIASYDVLAASR